MIYLLLGTLALGLIAGYVLRILHEHNNYLLSVDKFFAKEERDNSPLVELIFAVLAAFVFYLCAMFLIFPEVLQ